jgi:hypothetical protein
MVRPMLSWPVPDPYDARRRAGEGLKQRSSKQSRAAAAAPPVAAPGSPARWALLFGLLVALVTWPLLDPRRMLVTDDGFVSDATMAGLPFRAVLAQALRGRASFLWCPEIYSGFPIHALPEAGFFYPPHWLFALAGPVPGAQACLFLHLVLAGAGIRRLIGRDGIGGVAALYGALAFAGGGFLVAHLKHLAMVEAAAYLPWLLAGVLGFARAGGRVPLLMVAISVAGMGLAGHPQILLIGLLAAVGLGAAALIRIPARSPVTPASSLARAIGGLAAAVVIGLLTASIQLVPAAALARGSARSAAHGAAFAEQIPLAPANLATTVWARAVGMAGDGTYNRPGIHWEDYSYQGLLTWPLAIVALASRRRGSGSLAILGVVALLLALGARGGVYPVLAKLLPVLGWFRFPARFLVLTELAGAMLAAMGLEALGERHPALRRLGMAAVVVLALDLVWAQRPLNGYAPRAEFLSPPATLADLRPGTRYLTLGAREAHLFANSAARGWANVEPYLVQRRFLQPSSNLFFGASAADGYANPVPDPIRRLWGDHYGPGFLTGTFDVAAGQVTFTPAFFALARLAEVKTILSLWQLNDPRFTPIAARPPVFSYALADPLPHARFVQHSIPTGDPAQAASRMAEPTFDPAAETLLLASPDIVAGVGEAAVGEGAPVVIQRRTATELVCRVTAPAAGVLRVSESFDRGWQATVDGVRAAVWCADLGQQAVPVPAGEHTVRLRYRPRPWIAGVALSAVGVLGIGGIAVVGRKPRVGRTGGRG